MGKEFDFVKLGVTLMSILENRHVNPDLIQVKVRAAHPALQDNLAGVICIVQQMSLMLDDLDPNRVFLSQAHRSEVRDAFKSALTELYNLAQPELEDYIFDDEELPKPAADDAQDIAFDTQLDSFDKDPELKEMVAMFESKGLI